MERPTAKATGRVARIETLRSALQLGVAGTVGVATLAEAVHRAVLSTPPLPVLPGRWLAASIPSVAYASVRGIAGLVGQGGDRLLRHVARAASPDGLARAEAEVAMPLSLRAAVNGVAGDRLVAMGNAIALPMTLHAPRSRAGLAAEAPRVLFVHGLCMHDGHWRDGPSGPFDEPVCAALGARAAHLRYNSGLPIVDNGRALADRLEARIRAGRGWRGPLVIIAHSLGGLVVRSALADGIVRGHAWPGRVRDVVFLGTPHGGAPLERLGGWVEGALSVSRYAAPWQALGRVRSVAIRQLGEAALRPPPGGFGAVRFHAVAGRWASRASAVGDAWGDGLVPVASALGRSAPMSVLPLHSRRVFPATGHFDLMHSAAVRRHVVRLLGTSLST